MTSNGNIAKLKLLCLQPFYKTSLQILQYVLQNLLVSQMKHLGALQCKFSVRSAHFLPNGRSLFPVKNVIFDLSLDTWQNHRVGTVSLSSGENMER